MLQAGHNEMSPWQVCAVLDQAHVAVQGGMRCRKLVCQ
jgi:hypothetical protein